MRGAQVLLSFDAGGAGGRRGAISADLLGAMKGADR